MPTEETPQKTDMQTVIATLSEDERLRRDIYRPDKEKFLLFTQMLRRNVMFKNAKITHKPL
jgi:hypothetical protein